jgi:MinD-like ATPase involved in chromosome partitioning or flagellar assembly
MVILDTGSGLTDNTRRFWAAADQILVVTTADSASVMDAYAAIKVLAPGEPGIAIRLVANQCDVHQAAEVHQRIDRACQRFLALKVDLAGHVPVSLESMGLSSEQAHTPEMSSALHELAASVHSLIKGDASWAPSPTSQRRHADLASVL